VGVHNLGPYLEPQDESTPVLVEAPMQNLSLDRLVQVLTLLGVVGSLFYYKYTVDMHDKILEKMDARLAKSEETQHDIAVVLAKLEEQNRFILEALKK
jgi:hypothetical protein